MKKHLKKQANRRASSMLALSGAGAAMLAGGVAEGAIVGGHLGVTVTATKTSAWPETKFQTNVALVFGQDFGMRVTQENNWHNLIKAQAGDLVYGTTGGGSDRIVGINFQLRDPRTPGQTNQGLVRFSWGQKINGRVLGSVTGTNLPPPETIVTGFASELAAGSLIGPSVFGSFMDAGHIQWTSASVTQNSRVTGDAYLGFYVQTGSGEWHYGWIYLTGIGSTGDGFGFTIDSYGISQKANKSIKAGDYDGTEAGIGTPEPAAAGLGLLALGAAGVLRQRRKREKTA